MAPEILTDYVKGLGLVLMLVQVGLAMIGFATFFYWSQTLWSEFDG